jgi:hypothetical protein
MAHRRSRRPPLAFLLVASTGGCAPAPVDTAADPAPECTPWTLDPVAGWVEDALPSAASSGSFWPGAALADLDGDGTSEIVFANSLGASVVRSDPDGGYAIALLEADGAPITGVRAVAAADLDEDGDMDLFLGGEPPAPSRFLLNDGHGTFTASVLTDFDHRVWSAAFGEFTGDDRLDLFVSTYDADLSLDAILAGARGSGQALLVQDSSGGWFPLPGALPPFTDDALSLQGAPFDADTDGDLDVYLVNDFGPYAVPNQVLLNDGTGHFTAAAGTGADLAIYAMGAGVGDLDGDGLVDLFVSDVGPPHHLVNTGGVWADATQASGAWIAPTPTNLTSWAVAIADMDQDGWDDVLVSYGGLGSDVDVGQLENADPSWTEERDQDSLLLRNEGEGRFRRDDDAFQDRARARGLAVGDLDGDGLPDLVTWGKAFLHVFHASGGCPPGVTVVLDGPPGNPHGIGARVDALVAGRTSTRWLLPSVTAGQSALEVYVGTGGLPIDTLTVRWPDGRETGVGPVPAGRRVRVGVD